MKKQTVTERYVQQQMMQGNNNSVQNDSSQMKGTQRLQLLFKQTEQAILQAHQSVRQAQLANPTQLQLNLADQRLQYATQQLQQLKTAEPNIALGLPKGTQQQLTQLDHQIQQACQTLQLIQTTIS